MPAPLSRDDIDKIRTSGQFGADEITQTIDAQRPAMNQAGFTNPEIDAYYGVKQPDPTPIHDFLVKSADQAFNKVSNVLAPYKNVVGPNSPSAADYAGAAKEMAYGGERQDLPSFSDFWQAGWQNSVEGLRRRQAMPDIKVPDDAPLAQKLVMDTSRLIGDAPYMGIGAVVGGVGGGPAAPITALGGAFALPAALRRVYMDQIQNGEIKDFAHFWDLFKGTSYDAFKGYITGAATALAGKAAPGWWSVPAEAATMTTVGSALEGQMPKPSDFLEASLLMGAMHKSGVPLADVTSKMQDVFVRTGKTPKDMIQDANQDPTVKEDIASSNIDVPRSYQAFDQTQEAQPATPESIDHSQHVPDESSGLAKDYPQTEEGMHQAVYPDAQVETSQEVTANLWKLSPEHLDDLLRETKMSDQEKLVKALGEEGAAEFKKLERQSNSMDTARADAAYEKMKAIDDKMTPEQYRLVYGRHGDGLAASDIAVVKDAHTSFDGQSDMDVAWEGTLGVRRVAADKIRDVPVKGGSPEAQAAYIRFGRAVAELKARGMNMERIPEFMAKATAAKSGMSLGDATSFIEDLIRKTDKAAELPSVGAIESTAAIKAIDYQRSAESTKPSGDNAKSASGATPTDRILARLSIGESKKKSYNWNDLYRDAVDNLDPLSRAVKAMTGDEKLPVAEDPYKLARLTRGVNGKAQHFIEHGTFGFKDFKDTGPGLKQILDPVKDDLDGFRAYITAKRVVELESRGIKTGVDLEDAKSVVGRSDNRASQFAEVADRLDKYQDQTLRYLKDSGIISDQMYDAMKEANKDYVPFYRVMDHDPKLAGMGKGFQANNPVKKIKGSERLIVDPLESVIKNTYLFINMAERNNVARALVDLAEKHPEQGETLIRKAKTSSSPITVSEEEMGAYLKPYEEQYGVTLDPQEMTVFRGNSFFPKENQVAIYKDGKRTLYDVDPELAGTLKALDTETANTLLRMLALPTQLLRAGVTLSPDFIIRNIERDQLTAGVFSEGNYKPFVSVFGGLASAVKKDQAFQDWLKSGGANANFVSLDREYLQEHIDKVLTSSPVWNEITHPMGMLRVLSEFSENATRVGEFKRVAGKSPSKEDILKAGYSSREVTLDFSRTGAKTKAANLLIAFWNANVQGVDRTARAFKNKPLVTTAKVMAGITLPSVLLYLSNRNDKRYRELEHWQKDNYWIFLTDNHIFRVPKPPELGMIFGTGAERLTEYILSKDPKAFDGFLQQLGASQMPGVTPTAATPFIETWANKNLFTDTPLVPADREGMLPEYQFRPYTTELTKKLGSLVAGLPGMKESKFSAPVNIDAFIHDWSGSVGVSAMDIADYGLRKAGLLPDPPKPSPTLSDLPFVKAFVVRYPSMGTQPISDFYDAYNSNQMALETIKKLGKEGNIDQALREYSLRQGNLLRLEPIKQSMSNASRTIQMIQLNPSVPPPEKRQLIDKLYIQVNEAAKQGLHVIDQMNQTIKQK